MSCKATINEVLLRFGFIRPDVPVQDAAGTPPKPSKTTQSLQAHDKQYHPNGWKPGDKCRLRDSIFNVDNLGSPTTGQGQQQPQQSSQGQTTQAVQPNNQDFPTFCNKLLCHEKTKSTPASCNEHFLTMKSLIGCQIGNICINGFGFSMQKKGD